MRVSVQWCARALALGALVTFFSFPARAQQHVVSLNELKEDSAKPAQVRHSNEQAIRGLLGSAAGQKALQAAGVDYQKVDKAVAQLSDEEAARLATRARQAQKDFAAGTLSDRDLLWIILIIVAVLVVALAVR
ncbi:MAG TPA: PA2779 family protein [Candidatus Acidoferrum sp.]|nr:PA2779 family protein [Candidatus Acidoferrum sp.]